MSSGESPAPGSTHVPAVRPVEKTSAAIPLFVDLDGTLVATDVLWESLLVFLRRHPLQVWRLPLWLLQGRAAFKRHVSEWTEVDAATLPYRAETLALIDRERAAGRPVILATASDEKPARAIAAHLGVFDDVIASGGSLNLKGSRKLTAIREKCAGEFDYVGDHAADLPIWKEARRSWIVGPRRGLVARAKARGVSPEILPAPGGGLGSAFKALRPHQWSKNVLVFVPLVTAQLLTDRTAVLSAGIAFGAFCLAASSCYLLNDLLDLESDRLHASKKNRPLAAGRFPIPLALVLCGVLFLAAVTSAAAVGPPVAGMILLYTLLTTLYSLWLKRKLMVDVLCVAGLYSLRILTGGVAAGILISPWLLAFSTFLFLSLAFAKRYTEIDASNPGEDVAGRGYARRDLDMVRSVGPTSGYLAVLVFCLYINSVDVSKHYRWPGLLWLACPLMLYWITRIWFIAQRRQLHHDPVVFALTDRISYVTAVLIAAVLMAAR